MRLNEITIVEREVDQLVAVMLTEDTILEEGRMKDLLRKGKNQVADVLRRGRVEIDQLKMNVTDRIKQLHGDKVAENLSKVASRYAKPALMFSVVGAAMLGMDTVSASEMLDTVANLSPDQVNQYLSQPPVSPKLVNALTDKMDGIFQASTEAGTKTLTGEDAVRTAIQAHGVSAEEMIEHLMKNVNTKEELVNQFKKWVGAGIKKKLGMDV